MFLKVAVDFKTSAFKFPFRFVVTEGEYVLWWFVILAYCKCVTMHIEEVVKTPKTKASQTVSISSQYLIVKVIGFSILSGI